jgi:uncharacterized membrane protein
MRTKRAVALSGALVLGMVLASLLAGPRLPETMAVHWNAAGQVDGTMGKLAGQFVLPAITAFVLGVLFVAPRVDPERAHVEAFREQYDDFVVVVTAFLALVHLAVLAVNLGYDVPMTGVVFGGVGLLVFYLGTLLDDAKQNWVFGIRTPWTLSDEDVWDRTHEVGAWLFKLSGVVALAGVLVPVYAVWLVVAPLVASTVVLTAYSYYLYARRENGEAVTAG